MPRLTTRTKLRIAASLSRAVIALRALAGKGGRGRFRRRGLEWELDLGEGIDLAIYLFGRFEGEVVRAYAELLDAGATVFDIGANVGAHTLPIARAVGAAGRVHAVEATEFAVAKLRRNLELNPGLAARVSVHHTMLTDGTAAQAEVEAIPSSWNLRPGDGEVHPQHGGTAKALGGAGRISLDELVAAEKPARIDLVKLDVDGNEWPVLRGGRAALAEFRPPILMEFAPDYDPAGFAEMLELFRQLGYAIHSLEGGAALPATIDGLRAQIPQDGSINVLIRP